MGTTSQDFILYVPESGHPTSDISPLKCGDITQVTDVLGGQIQSLAANSPHTNKAVEIHRFREFNQSVVDITVPEDVADELHVMRNDNCMIGAQRRCGLEFEKVLHYGWISLSSVSLTNPTSGGPTVTDSGVPTKQIPGIFGLYQIYDGSGPGFFFDEGLNPVHVEYCDCSSCSSCAFPTSGCGRMFSLLEDRDGVGTIKTSVNEGDTWLNYIYLPVQKDETAFHCFNGSIIIAFDDGDGNSNAVVVPDAHNPTSGSPPLFTYRAFSTIGASATITPIVTKIVSSGHMLYAAWVSSSGEFGLDRSIDGGITWDLVLEPGVPGPIVDVAARGSCVAFIVEGITFSQIFLITDNGNEASSLQEASVPIDFIIPDPGVPLSAIALAIPDFTKPSCPLIYIASDRSVIYAGTKDGVWERKFQDESFCSETTPAHLETSIDGFGIWFSRAFTTKGKIITLKNVGRGSLCDWLMFEDSIEEVCLDCGGEIQILSCAAEPETNRFQVTLSEFIPPGEYGQVTVCFGDGTHLPGYIEPGIGAGIFILSVFSDDVITCAGLGGIASIDCLFCTGYPCKSWHRSAFAMCPADPNKGFVLGGAACPPDVHEEITIIVKDIDEFGNITQIVVCGEDECIPQIGCA